MKEIFIEKSLKLIETNNTLSFKERKKIIYGLTGLYVLITKFLILSIIALLSNSYSQFILILVVYGIERLYGFGIHMNSSLSCYIMSIILLNGGSILCKHILLPLNIRCILWIFIIINFILYAPADTEKRPLIYADKRKHAKKMSLLILIFLLIISIKFPVYKNIIIYASFLETISINPLTYKAFKMKYNNYKTFERK